MKFEVTILGCGSAVPTLRRAPSSQLVSVQNKSLLIDCGEGTQIRLREMKLKMQRIRAIFISHLHGDHYLGIVGLISTLNLLGRSQQLLIVAPKELEKVIQDQLAISDTRLRFDLQFEPLTERDKHVVFEEGRVRVEAFPLDHRIPTWGFLVTELPAKPKLNMPAIRAVSLPVESYKYLKEGEDYVNNGITYPAREYTIPPPPAKRYAYCSDTRFNESVAEHVKGADLLYHESTFLEAMAERAAETYHSTARQAARIARKAGAGRLLLGHYSARYRHASDFEVEAELEFPNVTACEDGMSFRIE